MSSKTVESGSKVPLRKSFSKVGILGDKKYSAVLKQFKSENVLVYAENDMTFVELKNAVKLKDKQIKGSVLWLVFTGIHSVADFCRLHLCKTSKCKRELWGLELEKHYYDSTKAENIISRQIDIIIAAQKEVKDSCLKEESDCQIMPPLPISVLTNKYLTHDQIHTKYYTISYNYVIVDKTHLTILRDVYNRFCKAVCNALQKAGSLDHPSYCLFLEHYKRMEFLSVLKNVDDNDYNVKLCKREIEKLLLNCLEKANPASRTAKSDESGYSKQSVFKKYDQIMFVSSETILSHLSKTFPSECSIFNVKFPLNWLEICDGVTVYKAKYKNILFIIVADLTIITREEFDNSCQDICDSKISYVTLENSVQSIINNNIKGILDVKVKLEAYFQDKDCVLVAPLFPRLGIRKPYLKSESFHSLMHKVSFHSSAPLFLDGQMSIWDNAISILKDVWYEQFGTVSSSIIVSDVKGRNAYKTQPLSWQLCSECSLNEKSFVVSNWDEHLGEIVKHYNCNVYVAQEGKQENKPAIGGKTTACNLTQRKHNEPADIGRDLSHYKVHDWTTKGYIIGGNNFINVLSDLQNFQNLSFLKKNFSNLCNLNIQTLLSELGVINKTNVLFCIFDISLITSEIGLDNCRTYKCEGNHVAFTIPFINDKKSFNNCKELAQKYVEDVDAFLKICGNHVTALPLPLPPSQLYCNMEKFKNNHNNLDWIYKQAHLASGDLNKWHKYLKEFQENWKSLLLEHYSKFPNCIAILNTYLDGNNNIFKLSKYENSFTGDVSAYEKWINAVNHLVLSMTTKDLLQNESNHPTGGSVSVTSHFGNQNNVGNNYWQSEYAGNNQMHIAQNFEVVHPIGQQENVLTMQPPILQSTTNSQMGMAHFPTNVHQFANDMQPMPPNIPAQFMHEFQTMQQLYPLNQQHTINIPPPFHMQGNSVPPMQQSTPQNYQTQNTTLNIMNPVIGVGTSIQNNPLMYQNVSHLTPTLEMNPVPVQNIFDEVDLTLLITGYTSNLPIAFLLDFVSNASKKAKILEQKKEHLKILLPSSIAHMVVNTLDNIRIGDSYIQAKYFDNPSMKKVVTNQQNNFLNRIYKKAYSKWSPAISTAMEKQLLDGLDVATFKTRFCVSACKNGETCKDYHWVGDKRRNPLVNKYSANMCDKDNENGCRTGKGQKCKFSHNLYEQMYHPNYFQTVLCRSSETGEECLKYPFCKFAHIDSPQLFYTKYWTDLIVFGLENSITYVAGALKAGTKMSQSNIIYFLSANIQFLKLLKRSLHDTAKTYNMEICLLDDESYKKKANLFLGLPSTVHANKMLTAYENSGPKVLIVDDVEAIFKNDVETEALNSFYQRLKRCPQKFAAIQKVFIVSSFNEKTSGMISRFFGIPLKAVIKKDIKGSAGREAKSASIMSVKKNLLDSLKSSALLPGKQTEQKQPYNKDFSQNKTKMSYVNKPQSVYSNKNSPAINSQVKENESYGKTMTLDIEKSRFSNNNSYYSERNISKNEAVSSNRSDAKESYGKTSRFDAEKSIFSNTSEMNSSKNEAVSNEKNFTFKWPQKRKFSNEPQNDQNTNKCRRSKWDPVANRFQTEEPKSERLPNQTMSKNSQIGPRETVSEKNTALMKDFLNAKVKLIQEHEEETRVFMELPEIHPDYEKAYGSFINHYRNEFGDIGDENHLNDRWDNYWKNHLNLVKNDHLEKKIRILRDTLGIEEEEKQERPSSRSESQEEVFTVAKTLDILEELKEKFGILGHSLQEMINFARKSGPESDGALEVFADSEHAQLCKIIIDKMIVLKNSSRYTGPIYNMAIQWTNELLDRAANHKKNNTKINIESTARETIGKGPSFTLNVIKRKLLKEGNSQPRKELVNKLYLDVCSAHFNLTMGQD